MIRNESGAAPQSKAEGTGLALAVLAASQLIIAVDYNIVYVTLPAIGSELGFTDAALQWVVSAYALAFGGFLLLGGRAADLLDRRTVFVAALGLYAAGSLVGGLAENHGLLIGARIVQGLGGAFLFPVTLAILTGTFAEGPQRNRALAVWSAAGASGGALGALLGGLLTDSLGWRSTFFVVVPIALLVGVLAVFALPGGSVSGPTETTRRPTRSWREYDVPGSITATVGSLAIVFALFSGPESGWTSTAATTGFVVAALSLSGFLVIEAKAAQPLMPLSIFHNRQLSTGAILTGLHFASFGGQFFLVTTWLQGVRGFSALEAGLGFVPLSLAIVAGTVIGNRMITLIGARQATIAALLMGAVAFSTLGLTLSAGGSYLAQLLPWTILSGLAMGIAWTAQWIIASTGVPERQQGIASGIASTTQQVGGAIGLAALIAISSAVTASETPSAESVNEGLRAAFLAAAGINVLGVIAAVVGLRRSMPRAAPQRELTREDIHD